jgi:drug/metabolite transporter (DMT)-like permease
VVAITLGVLFLGERVAPAALLGTALVLAGAWLTSRREAPAAAATLAGRR